MPFKKYVLLINMSITFWIVSVSTYFCLPNIRVGKSWCSTVWALGGLLCHELEIYSRRFGACRRYPAIVFHVVTHVSSSILPPLFPAVPPALLMRQQRNQWWDGTWLWVGWLKSKPFKLVFGLVERHFWCATLLFSSAILPFLREASEKIHIEKYLWIEFYPLKGFTSLI